MRGSFCFCLMVFQYLQCYTLIDRFGGMVCVENTPIFIRQLFSGFNGCFTHQFFYALVYQIHQCFILTSETMLKSVFIHSFV